VKRRHQSALDALGGLLAVQPPDIDAADLDSVGDLVLVR